MSSGACRLGSASAPCLPGGFLPLWTRPVWPPPPDREHLRRAWSCPSPEPAARVSPAEEERPNAAGAWRAMLSTGTRVRGGERPGRPAPLPRVLFGKLLGSGLSPPRGPRTPDARGDRDLAALRGRGELAFGTQDPRRALRLRLRDASDFPSHFKTAGSRGPRWVHQRGLPRQDPLPELPRGSWSKLPSRALASAARLGEVPAPAHPAPGPGHLAPPPPRARLLLPPASLPRGERLSLTRRHRAVPSMPRTSEPASLPGHAGKSGTLGERARPDARPWPPSRGPPQSGRRR